MNLKNAIGVIAHKLFDWKTIFNPLTHKFYPELYNYHGGVVKSFIINPATNTLHITEFKSLYPSLKRKS